MKAVMIIFVLLLISDVLLGILAATLVEFTYSLTCDIQKQQKLLRQLRKQSSQTRQHEPSISWKNTANH